MNMLALPEELLVEIMQWLPLKGLANTMQVNQTLHRVCRDDRLWLRHRGFPYRLKNESAGDKNGSVGNWLAATIKGEKQPPARLCHSAVVHGDSMYINGGHTTVANTQLFSAVKSDFWSLNLVTRRWEEIQEPKFPTRTEHSAVVWDNKMWLFGGFAGTHFSAELNCYDFQTKTLTQVTGKGDIPAPRSAHVAVAYEGKMWVFGGWNGNNQNNEVYSFDFETHEWTKVAVKGISPLPRCSHCAALAPTAKSFFVFGGCGGKLQNYLADMWQFNFETLSWTDVGRLQPGSRMRMVEYRNKLYIYGGWNSKEHFNSFNEFDIATQTWRDLEPNFGKAKGKMGQFSMCVFNHKMFQFAGYNDEVQTATSDLHVYRIGKPEFTEGSTAAR